jgi:hypothetical protein
VRLCFGDPSGEAVAIRDREEGLKGTLAAKVRSALTYHREAAAAGDIEMRLHSCTLYASLSRYDDQIMVNPHAWGEPASANPVFHMRRLDGGQVAATYMDSFERVWDTLMGHRIDYHDDPAAPEPNSLVPAAVAVVAREDGAVLLIRRTDNGNWALPGGAIEMNESVADVAIRETFGESTPPPVT